MNKKIILFNTTIFLIIFMTACSIFPDGTVNSAEETIAVTVDGSGQLKGNLNDAIEVDADNSKTVHTGDVYDVKIKPVKKNKEKSDINAEKLADFLNLSIKDFSYNGNGDNFIYTLSDGTKYTNPKELNKREKQLKRLQRKLARQINHSKNYNKTKIRLARVHSKIKNSRKHNIINIVNEIVKEYDCIISEKLNTKGMSQNHKLAKSIIDASFNKICQLLKWKTKILGKYYYQVDTYYPSSKTCSHCDYKTNITNNLNIRNWECPKCGNLNDRDINASINIMFEGLKIHYLNKVNN